MRLIDPGVGEIVDRLSILALKILFGGEANKDVAHFQRERTALLAKIRGRDATGPWFHLTFELSAVNAALWHAEDDLRILRTGAANPSVDVVTTVAMLAFRIQALNDTRADLVAAINKEAGDGNAPEKLAGVSA